MSLSQRLIDSAQGIWKQCEEHPFVRGIADGTLDVDKFRYFLLQDYVYLFEYARVFAVGVDRARSVDSMRVFAAYINEILEGEMDIHKSYMKRLGISEKAAEEVQPALDNISYTSYMLAIARGGTEAEIASSILACAVSYEQIARNIAAENPKAAEHPFFGEWINGYACEEYHDENVKLCELMDRQDVTEEQYARLEEIFINCSRYELGFWDMAWEMRD